MNSDIRNILEGVRGGALSVDDALLQLKQEPFAELGYAKVDLHRKIRQGAGEVIYGAGKTAEQITGILTAMQENGQKNVLITRLDAQKATAVSQVHPIHYNAQAGIGILGENEAPHGMGTIVVATGGTSDVPVAEEAALTAEFLGNPVLRLYDVGVAGIHRLLSHSQELMSASVIAVPTSVGYGASFGGIAALLSMLNSCASGTAVVNIDNGFGAGYMASTINHMEARH